MVSAGIAKKLIAPTTVKRRSGDSSISDELIQRAFNLAYFILGDRTPAIYVAAIALEKLRSAQFTQTRRLHYVPTGRLDHPAARNKIRLTESHLLQTLIYVASELYERLLEDQQQISYEDWIIHYVKHLVRRTIKQNSFHVALGICRLLYNYSTCETADIYNFVLQDPERMRDDDYIRARKKVLVEEVQNRFGVLVQTRRCYNGEQRFKAHEPSAQLLDLVKECLTRFTPWQSRCILPSEIDPHKTVVPHLLFEGKDPDKEHKIELNRIHTLLHPPCFQRLTVALGIDPPERRLEVPYFLVSSQDFKLDARRFNSTPLTSREIGVSRNYLNGNSVR